MKIDPPTILTLAQYAVIALGVFMFFATIVMVVSVRKTGKDAFAPMQTLCENGGGVEYLAVMVIVLSVTLLSLFGVIEGASVATIFSGIAGYVLGGTGKIRAKHLATTKKKSTEENHEP